MALIKETIDRRFQPTAVRGKRFHRRDITLAVSRLGVVEIPNACVCVELVEVASRIGLAKPSNRCGYIDLIF